MLHLPGYVCAAAKFVPGYGLVKLDELYQGLKYASINTDTKGRDLLTKDRYGQLVIGCRVVITDVTVGTEALLIKEIARE